MADMRHERGWLICFTDEELNMIYDAIENLAQREPEAEALLASVLDTLATRVPWALPWSGEPMADIERYSGCERCGSTPLICGMCDHRQRGAEVERLREALCELHRAVTEDDMSDADEARLLDAVAEAQRLAPYIPQPVSEDGF